jgi:hypothetical protein
LRKHAWSLGETAPSGVFQIGLTVLQIYHNGQAEAMREPCHTRVHLEKAGRSCSK